VVVGAVVVVVGALVVVVGAVVVVLVDDVDEVVTVVDGVESSSVLRRASHTSTPAAMTMATISATNPAVAQPERPGGGGPAGVVP
jgi:hypothetical protein